MKKIVVNLGKLKQKHEEEKTAASSKKEFDPRDSILLKPLAAGKVRTRVVPYIHNPDPSSEPFVTRAYHYGIPGSSDKTFYCPQENDKEPCAICDFVWDRMKESKGNKVAVSQWSKYLPKYSMFVPVWVYDRSEEEGVKLLRLSVKKKDSSKHKDKLYEFFYDDETAMWMDPDEGFDLRVEYTAATEDQKKLFSNAKFMFEDFELARSPSKFEHYMEALEKVPNIDETYPVKTSEDAIAVLSAWAESLGIGSKTDDDDDGMVVEETKSVKVVKQKKEKIESKLVNVDDLESELKALGVDDD